MMGAKTHRYGLLLLAAWISLLASTSSAQVQTTAPYPPSTVISGITFDWSTHQRYAEGSDNWAITWGEDDHQYTTWGDGGGFNSQNQKGRVSLGFARVEGAADSYTGYNIWGGFEASHRAQFGGKSYGIIAIRDVLYMWRCGKGSGASAYDFQELYTSTNQGEDWEQTGIKLDTSSFAEDDEGFFCPTFLQFGRGYQGARDDYVYLYAPEIQTQEWVVQTPGEIALIRVPVEGIADLTQYEFFAGLDSAGKPVWTPDIATRQPVFEDRVNGVMRTSISYNPGLRRYFLITEHTERSQGNIGIYDAPEPWGPWTTVLYQSAFGEPDIEPSTFFWNFSNKWLSLDGKDFVLVFTGRQTNDSWNTVHGHFVVSD